MSSGGFKVPQLTLGEVPTGADAGKYLKLGQRVSKACNDRQHDELKQLDPQSVLPDPSNRGGAPPHVMYIHLGILKGMLENGYDPSRPKEGSSEPADPVKFKRGDQVTVVKKMTWPSPM